MKIKAQIDSDCGLVILGIRGFLQKPMGMKILAGTIREVLR